MKYLFPVLIAAAFVVSVSAPAVPQTIINCMGCHDGSDPQIPALPLDNWRALRANPNLINAVRYRISPGAGDKRMPPNRFLTAAERAEVERYLRTGR